MRDRLLFLLLLVPFVSIAQTDIKNGTITIDFSKKKAKHQDSIPAQTEDDEDSIIKPHKVKRQARTKPAETQNAEAYDFKKDGLFKGLFHAGITACQIDGDHEGGYKYLGATGGVGALFRFHKYLSASLELNYAMEGARASLPSSSQQLEKYMVQWDYLQMPLALNAHIKEMVMFSIGLQPGVMVRYKEQDYNGFDVTRNPPFGQPSRFELSGIFAVHFIIKKHYALGGKFSYSAIKVRTAFNNSIYYGQFNNILSFRFMYILGPVKKK